jgi:hypothetical protein
MMPHRGGGKGSAPNPAGRTATATGALLIVATTAALAAAALNPATPGTDYLREVAEHRDWLAVAALLHLIAAATSVGIAIVLYPLLRRVDAAVALGSVVFRTIEAVFYIAAVVSLLSIPHLDQQLATAPAADPAIHEIAETLLSLRDHCTLAGVFAFCVGALMYYALFYRSRLVPRWLSVWGLAGALLMMSACLLALFRSNAVTGYTVLILPIAVQEMVLALWLLVKGFNPLPHTFSPAAGSRATDSGMARNLHEGR